MANWQLRYAGPVAVATFDRPPRNFLSFVALEELAGLLRPLGSRADIGVIVLESANPRYFLGHGDLEDISKLVRGQPVQGDPMITKEVAALLEELPQPVIAAINAATMGGGSEIALACTLRIAACSATLAQPEIALAMIPGAGGTQRLSRLIGSGRALEMILSGRPVSAEEALAMGLVQVVLPDADFRSAALKWARGIARRHPPALAAAKRAVIEGLRRPFDKGLELEMELITGLITDPVSMQLQAETLRRYATASPETVIHL